ncbi:unnamed protein product [Closterium sp. Naga37s-1]|nr:unnamed protein product [Closterium sp. Naga37s-1]
MLMIRLYPSPSRHPTSASPPPHLPARRPISRARRPSPSRGPISHLCRPISPFRLLSPPRAASSPLPSPSLPPPVVLASPSRCPRFPHPLLVHLRHLSAWGSSITNASSSHLLAFPRSPSPPQTPTHSSSVVPDSLAPSVSVGQQNHQRFCLAAPRLPPPALRQPRLDCPLSPPRPPLPHRPPPLPLPPPFHWVPSPLLLVLSLRLLSFLLSLLLLLPPHSSGYLWCLNRSSLLPLPSSPPRLPHSPDLSTAAVPDALLLHLAHSLPHTSLHHGPGFIACSVAAKKGPET